MREYTVAKQNMICDLFTKEAPLSIPAQAALDPPPSTLTTNCTSYFTTHLSTPPQRCHIHHNFQVSD